jgi:hypothetical protein
MKQNLTGKTLAKTLEQLENQAINNIYSQVTIKKDTIRQMINEL